MESLRPKTSLRPSVGAPPRKCGRHGLAAGPGGQCTLCLREAGSGPPASTSPVIVFSAVIALAVAVVVVAFALKRPAAAQVVAENVVATPAAEPPPAPAAEGTQRPDAHTRLHPSAEPEDAPPPPPAREAETPPDGPVDEIAKAEAEAERTPDGAERVEKLHEAMHRVPIIVYSTSWCPTCRAAKQWLGTNGYAFVEKDVEADASARRVYRTLNPRGTVPTIDVGGRVLVGFSAQNLESTIRRSAARGL